jgi:RNA polymerase sigma-70 factor (ECF subfamily)
MPSESDRLLIQQIRNQEASAWQTLVQRYEGRLFAFVQRRLRDRSASEDVVQETFLGFLKSLPNYDENRELQTYLFTIASHRLTDYLRRNGRNPLRCLAEGYDELLDLQAKAEPTVSSMARSEERRQLEQQALTRCLQQVLRFWLEKGDWTRLKVMELLWVKGLPNREVALVLGVTEQQVANYRFAATKKLGDLVRNAGLSPDVFPELHPIKGEAADAETE